TVFNIEANAPATPVRDGWTFTDWNPTGNVTITGALTATAQYTLIPNIDLGNQTIGIASPGTGAIPQPTIASGTGYTGKISWTNVTDEESNHSGAFIGGEAYKATVTLTATTGYQWPATPPVITVIGQIVDQEKITVSGDGEYSTLTFEVTFAETPVFPLKDKDYWPESEEGEKEYQYVDIGLVIEEPLGEELAGEGNRGRRFITRYKDETFVIDGAATDINPDNLIAVLFNDDTLKRGTIEDGDGDYYAEEGSVAITIRAQTFERYGEGDHTITAVFSVNRELQEVKQVVTVQIANPPEPEPEPEPQPQPQPPQSGQSGQTTTVIVDEEPPLVPEPTHSVFSDVKVSDWFYKYVVWAYDNGYMVGVSENRFAPYEATSEAMIATVLARLAKADLSQTAVGGDEDIPSGKWYSQTATWAKANGLLGEKNFAPNEPATRGELALILLKFLDFLEFDYDVPETAIAFADADKMSTEENEAFQILYSLGIFTGIGENKMDPQGITSRAQLAALLYRVNGVLEEDVE
ncbi:MAG: S-layer homology domain-containing protein, partial [Synergistaceae bacterium]|nr:S-layer homology domain-containing protein [Synergistaceae bacterium]